MREFLKSKEFESDLIEEVMAEYGKKVSTDKEAIETLKQKLVETENLANTYKTAMNEVEEDFLIAKNSQKELEELKASIAEQEQLKKEQAENEKFENDLNAILGDRKFINDYTKQALVNELKNELGSKEDAKLDDVFNELTKDREDLFSNPNKVEIPATKEVDQQENKTRIPIMW